MDYVNTKYVLLKVLNFKTSTRNQPNEVDKAVNFVDNDQAIVCNTLNNNTKAKQIQTDTTPSPNYLSSVSLHSKKIQRAID